MMRRIVSDAILDLLTSRVSSMLERADREALCGDLAESGVSGLAALRDMASLVIRRKLAELSDVQPWLVFAFIAVPLGLLLSLAARWISDGSAIYFWLYINNWDPAVAQTLSYWWVLSSLLPGILFPFVALICWSWTTGLVIGTCGRRTIWFNGSTLLVVLFCIGIFGAPHELGRFLLEVRARDFPGNAAVFANAFYRAFFPQTVEVLLVILPFIYGMRRSIRDSNFTRLGRICVLISCAMTLGSLASQCSTWWCMRVWNAWPLQLPRLPSLMPLAIVGPVAYSILMATRRRRCRGYVGTS